MEFIKDKDQIIPMPKGLAYDLIGGKVYRLKSIKSMFSRTDMLIEDGELSVPNKVYYSKDEELIVKRVIRYHKETKKNTTGVMFYGKQGCGKTLLSKIIAKESGLPIIVVDPSFSTSNLMNFFTRFNTEVVVLFDELDKHCSKEDYWDTKDMLEFLDGVQETGKKLVIFTCNSDKVVNDFMKDRCGRIRYYKQFDTLSHDMIVDIVKDNINDKDKVDNVVNFIENKLKIPSYDNVTAICKEVNDWPDYSVEELIKDLNVELK